MNLSADKTDGAQKGRSKTYSTEENSKGKVQAESMGELKGHFFQSSEQEFVHNF